MSNPTTPALNLEMLCKRLDPPFRTIRVLNDTIIAICGSVGAVHGDLYINLRREALTELQRFAARELIDAGVLAADASDDLYVAALPSGDLIKSFMIMLGLRGTK